MINKRATNQKLADGKYHSTKLTRVDLNPQLKASSSQSTSEAAISTKNVQNRAFRDNMGAMMLLSFSIKNHKSIRDALVLDLTKPSLKTLQPREGTHWRDHVYSLAGIFGANASGKSAILDAFNYAFSAISKSATSWQAHSSMRRAPFLLDGASTKVPSTYEIDFIHSNKRYVYGFEVDGSGILREWLRDVPSVRWRTLLDRDRDAGTLKLHSSVPPLGSVTDRELLLSRAILLHHPVLGKIGTDLVDSFDSMTVKDTHRERRLASITESLANGSITFDDIVTLLQVADIGVEEVNIQEDALPTDVQEVFKGIKALIEERTRESEASSIDKKPSVKFKVELGVEDSDAVVRNMVFTHQGRGADRPPFPIQAESDGTIAWLALIVPALEILRCGGLYCVDEIDSSLHPHLLEVLLMSFHDPETNRNAAQLIFTSHDAYLLSPLSDVQLEPEQVWFTEKSTEGVTELSSLAEFPRHKDANVAKRYLTGRYGGTPRLAPSAIARLLHVEGK
ncbi:AAA family ATPase [Rhodococcus erythropolis]|uniref:AAA family ATPase n=1 Tax=Rhodococcus erythropolis TaxID=1833 RepID=UPI00404376A1